MRVLRSRISSLVPVFFLCIFLVPFSEKPYAWNNNRDQYDKCWEIGKKVHLPPSLGHKT